VQSKIIGDTKANICICKDDLAKRRRRRRRSSSSKKIRTSTMHTTYKHTLECIVLRHLRYTFLIASATCPLPLVAPFTSSSLFSLISFSCLFAILIFSTCLINFETNIKSDFVQIKPQITHPHILI
jgi:hypothetical protein